MILQCAVLFVPAGVGVMRCFGIIRDQWIPIVGATIISTFIIIAVTGWIHQFIRRSLSRNHSQGRHHGILSK